MGMAVTESSVYHSYKYMTISSEPK